MTAAQHAMAEGDYKLAAQRLVYARDAEPDNTSVLRLMTLAFWQSGNLTAAGRAVRDWARADRERPAAHRFAARIYEDMGAIDLAAEAADRAAARAPQDADAWERVGRLRLRLMDRAAAISALERARTLARASRRCSTSRSPTTSPATSAARSPRPSRRRISTRSRRPRGRATPSRSRGPTACQRRHRRRRARAASQRPRRRGRRPARAAAPRRSPGSFPPLDRLGRERLGPRGDGPGARRLDGRAVPGRPGRRPDLERVEFVVAGWPASKLREVPNLKVVQTRSAGVDWIVEHVPDGVTLCSAQGRARPGDGRVGALGDPRRLQGGRRGRAPAGRARVGAPRPARPRGRARADRRPRLDRRCGRGAPRAVRRRRGRAAWRAARATACTPSTSSRGCCPDADIVVNLLPATPATDGLFDAAMFAAMRDGRAVRQRRARADGRHRRAASPRSRRAASAPSSTSWSPSRCRADHPLWGAPNCILTPHSAGDTPGAERASWALAGEQLRRYAAGEELHQRRPRGLLTMARERGAELLVAGLEAAGVDVVFGLPGVHNLAAWEALRESPIRLVGVRHEQAAVYAADGYARASGRLGVALVTTGPGAANTLGAMRRGVGEPLAGARRRDRHPDDAAPARRASRRPARVHRPARRCSRR